MKFKNELCTYCQVLPADTADHVFARQLFLVKHRNNLPQVPSCFECNNDKSKLESYLATVLPIASRQALRGRLHREGGRIHHGPIPDDGRALQQERYGKNGDENIICTGFVTGVTIDSPVRA